MCGALGFTGRRAETGVSVETKRKLRDMGATDLLGASEAQDEGICMGATCAERAQMAAGGARPAYVASKARDPTGRANLRRPEAGARSIGFAEGRGLGRLLVTELSTCGFAERGQNAVFQDPTGTGKTYLACALAKPACQRRIRACHARRPDLEEAWRIARDKPGGERRLLRRHAAFQALALDEWPPDRPGELFRAFLLEPMELRYGAASTVFCAQSRQKVWHVRLGGGIHAGAVMDRIAHGTAWVEMGELNMRSKLGR